MILGPAEGRDIADSAWLIRMPLPWALARIAARSGRRMGEGNRRGDPSHQTTTGVDGIRFPDAFGPIVVASIVAGAVTLAILRSGAGQVGSAVRGTVQCALRILARLAIVVVQSSAARKEP